MMGEEIAGGSKWSKMLSKLKEDDEEEEDEAHDEEIRNIMKSEESEKNTANTHVAGSEGLSGTVDRVSMSFAISMQWLDKLCGIAPTSRNGQLIYMFTMLLIPLIPILALITQNIVLLTDTIERKNDLLDADKSVVKSDETARLISSLQKERTASLMQIFLTNTSKFTTGSVADLDLDIITQRTLTDEALENITGQWRPFPGEAMFQSKLRLQIRIDDFRELQDKRNLTSKSQNERLAFDTLDFYTYTTRVLLDDMSTIIRASNGSKTWRYLITYKNMLRAVESLGIEISYGIIFIGNGELSVKDYAKYVEKHKLCDEYMLQSQSFIPRNDDGTESIITKKILGVKNSLQYKQYEERYNFLIAQEKGLRANASEEIYTYFLNTYDIITMLREAIAILRMEMTILIGDELRSVDREYIIGIGIIAVLALLSPMIVLLVRNAVNALQVFSESFKIKANELKREKKKAENLIYQMLPKSVADNLRQNKATSEMFESATICFTEIDEFKNIARNCNPLQLFDLVNTIYKTFDARIDQNDVYKVETINDTYMVASGLPERNGDRHAAEIANLCIELMFITPGIMIPHDPSLRLRIKIGIHSGATTAGVVGSKMPRYCLFGDTVNVASRMRTTGEPMKIQMTYETKMLLDNLGGYTSEVRGQVEVKGKGNMDTYWLLSRNATM